MDQTKLTAHLPTVDVEITRRELAGHDGEAIMIHITASPSFDAAAQWLLQASLFPMASPLTLWADMMRVWQPWLPFGGESPRSLPKPD